MPTLAKIALLALAAALLVNLVQGGPDQVRAWASAKFLGRPAGRGHQQPAQPAAPSSPSTGGGGPLQPTAPGGAGASGGGGGGSF